MKNHEFLKQAIPGLLALEGHFAVVFVNDGNGGVSPKTSLQLKGGLKLSELKRLGYKILTGHQITVPVKILIVPDESRGNKD